MTKVDHHVCFPQVVNTLLSDVTAPVVNQADGWESQRQAKRDAREKVGRNDPCPCGSGKKYKKCHGLGQAPKLMREPF